MHQETVVHVGAPGVPRVGNPTWHDSYWGVRRSEGKWRKPVLRALAASDGPGVVRSRSRGSLSTDKCPPTKTSNKNLLFSETFFFPRTFLDFLGLLLPS